MLVKIVFNSIGAADSSITRYLLNSTIIDKGSIFIGQAFTQALQEVHAHNSSLEMESSKDLLSLNVSLLYLFLFLLLLPISHIHHYFSWRE